MLSSTTLFLCFSLFILLIISNLVFRVWDSQLNARIFFLQIESRWKWVSTLFTDACRMYFQRYYSHYIEEPFGILIKEPI